MNDITAKIGNLLAKAEATDNEHEREAYFGKAQALATTHSIDLAVAARQKAKAEQRETPVVERVNFGPLGTRNTKKSLVELFSVVARNNDIRMDIRHDSTGVILYGMPSDIDVAKALFDTLAVVMVREADRYIRSGKHKGETVYRAKRTTNFWGDTVEEWGHYPVDGRTARINFYRGFRTKIADRLREAKREAEAKVKDVEYEVQVDGAGEGVTETTTGELVLRTKREQVGDYYSKKSNARGSWNGSSSGAFSSGSYGAGQRAGRNARMGSHAGLGQRKALAR